MATKLHRIVFFRIVLAFLGTGSAIAETDPAERLATGFADLAGSKENAMAIVRGMNTGKVIAIRGATPEGGNQVHAFNMIEGALAWSDVEATLARVRTRFARQGVTQPTVEQLQAALVPGIAEGPRVAAKTEPGMPRVVSTTSTAPQGEVQILASAWGRYQPSERSSSRFERFPGIN